jgi:predicted GNAT superfamily acetyltransferase
MVLPIDDIVSRANAESASAAHLAGISVRELRQPEEMVSASGLLSEVWKLEPPKVHISTEVMTALAHAGNYVVGAFRDGRMIGVCVGFLAQPAGQVLHSHIAGVLPASAGGGVGRAIKLHQKAWCLERGLSTITWTFDPLVARNAYFNIHGLGAAASEYLVDFYGSMSDGINRGQPSDRMLLTWDLLSPPANQVGGSLPTEVLKVGPDASAVRCPQPDHGEIAVAIPSDIERLRENSPTVAAQWRIELRTALVGLMRQGWRIHDFSGDGHYLLRKDQ